MYSRPNTPISSLDELRRRINQAAQECLLFIKDEKFGLEFREIEISKLLPPPPKGHGVDRQPNVLGPIIIIIK